MLLRFNERLIELRKRMNLTQEALANRLDIKRSSVNSWEMGISEPTAKHIVDLAFIFNCSTDYLLSIDNKELVDISSVNEQDKLFILSLIDRLKCDE